MRSRSARPASSSRVKDSLESILDLAKTEGMLFKWGSGTGTNLSALREEDAILSGGGRASGPLSFMKGFDAFAGVIKSRRQDAARRQDGDPQRRSPRRREVHLVQGQGREEGPHAGGRRATTPRSTAKPTAPSSSRTPTTRVRATDEFMEAVVDDGDWWTKRVVTGQPVKRYKAQRPDAPDRRSHAPVRRSRACSSTPRSTAGIRARTRRASTPRIPARSTCSWTIRRATWRR